MRRFPTATDHEIARLAIPAFGALIAEPLYVLSDTAVVGHLGTPELGGLAIAGQALLTVHAVMICFAVAFSSDGFFAWFSKLGAILGGAATVLPSWMRNGPLAILRRSKDFEKSAGARALLYEDSAEPGIESTNEGEGDKPEDEHSA